MSKPVLPQALERIFDLMDIAVDCDTASLNVALAEDAANEEQAKLMLGHSIGLLMGVAKDHYPGGIAALKADLRRKFG